MQRQFTRGARDLLEIWEWCVWDAMNGVASNLGRRKQGLTKKGEMCLKNGEKWSGCRKEYTGTWHWGGVTGTWEVVRGRRGPTGKSMLPTQASSHSRMRARAHAHTHTHAHMWYLTCLISLNTPLFLSSKKSQNQKDGISSNHNTVHHLCYSFLGMPDFILVV